jgi:protein-disulfide isomerase
MRLQLSLAAMLALGAAACSGPAGKAKAPDSIDKMAKADVEAIVKEYLLREPEILLEMQTAFEKKQLDQQTAQAETAWPALLASAKDDPYIGPKDAPITMIEFSDYDCGVCKSAMPWVISQVDDRRGDIKLIIKEAAWRGEGSHRAAMSALAAHNQGKYREMHVTLMKMPSSAYTPEILEQVAQSIGLNIPRWKADMAKAETSGHVDRSLKEFESSGMRGTPAYLINGKFVGGFNQQELESLIEATRQMVSKKG